MLGVARLLFPHIPDQQTAFRFEEALGITCHRLGACTESALLLAAYFRHFIFRLSGSHRPSVRPSVYGVIQLGPAHNTLQTPMTTYFDTLSKVRPHPFHPPVLRAPVEMR